MQQRKTKILYIITKSNFGGAQRYVFELATNLPKDAYDVVVAFGGSGVLKEKLDAAGIRTVEIKSFQRDISILKEFHSFGELWCLYREERPDVVHLNSSKAGGSGALLARLAGVQRIVYTTHGWAFLERRSLIWRTLVWVLAYLTALLSHIVILVSEYERSHTHMPLVRRKLHVIHTAIPDIAFMAPAAARDTLFDTKTHATRAKDLWLITTAELNSNKNLFTAIDAVIAYNATHERKIFYSIIGDGELYEELRTYIIKHGAETQIRLLGYVDNARIYLTGFDMFLLPSHKEGLPYAILEAGAAGLPVIASHVGGIPEIIEDGKNGVLIDPNDTPTIIEALATLADDAALRARYTMALQKKVREQFTLSKMLTGTTTCYSRD